MEKLNIEKAIEYCKYKHSQKPLMVFGCGVDQEVLDFVNREYLRDQLQTLISMAKKFIGEHFKARVRMDDFYIIYELVTSDNKILATEKTNRGIDPQGEYEFDVFTIPDLEVSVEYGVAENSYSKPEKIVSEKQTRLFFAPPLKPILFM
jgi:hypothetical protein